MKQLLIAATALTLLNSGAFAQSYSNSGSNANASNTSASQSSSVSNPQVNVIGNPIGNGASSSYSSAGASANTRSNSSSSAVGNRSNLTSTTSITVDAGSSGNGSGGSGGDQTIHYSGGYTVRNTPEVMAPSVLGGNTCAIGASAGVALPGFGLAGGATWADKACERRQQAALLFNMGDHKAAFALMCQDEHVRQAMSEVGEPCLQDRRIANPAPVMPAPATAAVAVTPRPVIAAARSPAVVTAPRPKPAWCTPATVSPSHLNALSEGQRLYVHLQCGL